MPMDYGLLISSEAVKPNTKKVVRKLQVHQSRLHKNSELRKGRDAVLPTLRLIYWKFRCENLY